MRFRSGPSRGKSAFVVFLVVHVPVRVAEVEERRAVRVNKVLCAVCRYKTAPVYRKLALVGVCGYGAGLAVERRVRSANRHKIPYTVFRGGEADGKRFAAVPEARYRKRRFRLSVREFRVEYNVQLFFFLVALIRFKIKIYRDPRLCDVVGLFRYVVGENLRFRLCFRYLVSLHFRFLRVFGRFFF